MVTGWPSSVRGPDPICSHGIHGQDGMEAAQLALPKLVFCVVGTGVILSQEAACGKLRVAIL